MLTLVALLLAHVRVTVPPCTIVGEEAVRLTVGTGGGSPVTVTVVEEEALPPAPTAVILYMVVCAGETMTEPDSGRAVSLILGSTVTEVALALLQVSATD
jgi:hypothetical protein